MIIIITALISLVCALSLGAFLTWLESTDGSWARTVARQKRLYAEERERETS